MLGSIGGEAAFYEIAATLIPLFLLGGIVFERLRPRTSDSWKRVVLMSGGIPLVGLWIVFAEAVAVSSAVSGNGSWVARVVVASALSAGMVAVLISLWWPWVKQFGARHEKGISSNWHWWVAFGGIFLLATGLMVFAVSWKGSHDSKNATIEELNRADREIGDAEQQIESLAIERDRTNREYLLAMKPGIDCLTIRAFLVEEDDISRLLRREGDMLEAAVIEAGNLRRRLGGEAPDYESPFPPAPRFKPRAALVPLKRCLRQEQHEIRERHQP